MRRLCQMMAVHPSGYYAWRSEPQSERNKSDQRLMGLIKQSWLKSGGVYGYRKITMDLRDLGECCGKHRAYRLMRREGLRSQTGYRGRRGSFGKPQLLPPTAWSSGLMFRRRTRPGSPTSLISGLMKVGCIWP